MSNLPQLGNPIHPISNFASTETSLPQILPRCAYIEKNALVGGGWVNDFKRCFIPRYASQQDKKVSEFFINCLRKIVNSESSIDRTQMKTVLSLAEQHIARHQGWFPWESVSAEISRLEHYTLAIRQQYNFFEEVKSPQVLLDKCRSDNRGLLDRWNKLGFSEEIFWSHPDLVDFIFKAYLHRYITHPYYRHTISTSPCLLWRHGQIKMVQEPHLLMGGLQTPWTEIRKKLHIDSESRLYSQENGQKKHWTYLDQGLTPLNDDHFAVPQRLRKLAIAPINCKIQIVTTHAHREDWAIIDRVLEGTRHSFFRIIPGQGFSVRHPEMRLEQGSVYSFGWSTEWRNFSVLSPLSTLKGKWYSPDDWEFLKQDHCVTTIDVSDEKIIKLMEVIRRRSQEERPFHFITANCCGITAEVLNEAGIIGLCTKDHMSKLGYEFFVPKFMRTLIKKIIDLFEKITPHFIINLSKSLHSFAYSIVFAPLFSLLGAWRTNISYEDENREARQNMVPKVANRVKALFSNVYDFFNPTKMEFDMTKNIYQWQKKQPDTVYEKRN